MRTSLRSFVAATAVFLLAVTACDSGEEEVLSSPTASAPATADADETPEATGAEVSSEARTIIIGLGGRNGPRGIILDLSADILFDSGSSTLKAEADETIDKLARLTQLIRRDRILIVGHTDNVGGGRANQRLSVDRAQAVADALREGNAEVAGRIVVRGAGERQPVADNSTEEGRAKNRRVEIEFQGARFRP